MMKQALEPQAEVEKESPQGKPTAEIVEPPQQEEPVTGPVGESQQAIAVDEKVTLHKQAMAEAEKGLGIPFLEPCKRCESGKCADDRVAHCCDHEVGVFDDMHIFFPGVVFHELSHYLASKLAGVRVIAYKLWHPKVAWVKSETVIMSFNDVFISFAPLLFGSVVASILLISLYNSPFLSSDPLLFFFVLWLAVSIALMAPMSKQDLYVLTLALLSSFLRRKMSRRIFARFGALLIWPFLVVAKYVIRFTYFWFLLLQYLFEAVVFAILVALFFVR